MTKKKFKFKTSWLLIAIPLIFFLIFLVYPLIRILKLSVTDPATNAFTFEAYKKFFDNSLYFKVIRVTFKVSFFVTLFCLILGYPVAYMMTKCSKRMKAIIMILIMIPFWTSLLVRTYSWMILLQSNGVINNFLQWIGIIDEPLKLFKNTTGVYIGMVHILLPYMILSLYPVLSGIDRNYVSAAQNLGANKFIAFFKVYFPLSIQGISAGAILVFTMGIGYFITPSLLGGSGDTMISQMIQIQVSKLLNWQFASALSVILFVISMFVMYASKKIMKVDKVW